MPIATDLIEGVSKQYLIYNYLSNGMFVANSPFTKKIRSTQKEWSSNRTFDYYRYYSNGAGGGGDSSQVFNSDLSRKLPLDPVVGKSTATYGSIVDGFNYNMNDFLDTKNVPRAALLNSFALQAHSFRQGFAGMFINAFTQGYTGTIFVIDDNIVDDAGVKLAGQTLVPGVAKTFTIPANVANYGIKGKGYCIKSTGRYGAASAQELYAIQINKNRCTLTALPGSSPTPIADGDHFQRVNNRVLEPGATLAVNAAGVLTASGNYTADGAQPTSINAIAIAGFPKGLEDMFPSDFDAAGNRLYIDRYYDGDPNRSDYIIDRCGEAILRPANQSVSDFLFEVNRQAMLAAPGAPFFTVMHPDVLNVISIQDAAQPMIVRNIMPVGKYTYQKGVEVLSFTIGGKKFDNVVLDPSIPTNKVYTTVDNTIEYNAFTQTYAQIDQYILDTYGEYPDKIDNIDVVDFATSSKLDWGNRIAVGSPINGAPVQVQNHYHPSMYVPIAFQELGNFFVEKPWLTTVGNLGLQIVDPWKYV